MTRSGSFIRARFLVAATPLLTFFIPPVAFAKENAVLMADYLPVDPNQFCKRIYNYTYGASGSFTNQIVGKLTAPYTTQPLTGSLFCGFGNDISLSAWYNDGSLVANILDGDHYPSIDCAMTAYPAAGTISLIRDGDFLSFGDYPIIVRKHLGSCEISGDADETLLFRIQDVTAGGQKYKSAVVVWFLQNDEPFIPLDFHGKELELGITLPDATSTGGRRVLGVFILGSRAGVIAGGDIDDEAGTLTALYEQVSVDCAAEVLWDIFDVPGKYNAVARGINDNSDVVGDYSNPGQPSFAFVRRRGVLTLFDPAELPATTLSATDINNAGDIVGTFDDSLGRHGYLLRNGVYTRIDAPGGEWTIVRRINDKGVMVVSSYNSSNVPIHGFLLRDGVFTQIDVPGAIWTEALGLNNSGDIVGDFQDASGSHGFLLRGGTYITVNYPGAALTRLDSINDVGDMVGSYRMPGTGPWRGFLLADGQFSPVITPCENGTVRAFDLNEKRDIVGFSFDGNGPRWGFVVSDLKKEKLPKK